ncbi:glutamate racemase [Shewanella sp. Isolate11]|uniref:glutamate racemase n=1 Tax=Shewanella sp. Isolate11 TaxID=2908530 RepID=UPI001EFEDC02|nr:glutamate racemase [Shewanella sp. Isolate11]MCG9698000.1 glutamate racemase [Shewanella sp. Isolate11]
MSANILVFDSGVGGLSILSEIKQTLPNENYIYLFDNARLPYGELAEKHLIEGCVDIIGRAVQQLGADIVVVACNTASTLILPALRDILDVPVVGVVPAIKPAAAISKNKRIGLLATPGTVNRDYTHQLIKQFAADCKVTCFGSSELVMMAEAKMAQKEIDWQRLEQILQPIKQTGVDTLVLGCTHFPILKAELQSYLGEELVLLDSASAIASRVKNLLAELPIKNRQKRGSKALYTTNSICSGLERTLAEYGLTHTSPLGSMG